jgi:hypothetical protein
MLDFAPRTLIMTVASGLNGKSRYCNDSRTRTRPTMILPGETEAGMQGSNQAEG